MTEDLSTPSRTHPDFYVDDESVKPLFTHRDTERERERERACSVRQVPRGLTSTHSNKVSVSGRSCFQFYALGYLSLFVWLCLFKFNLFLK